ncbi:hypothetical protein BX600DRAFT_550556 [Xylariales sp. PMI_506]|nr:hypothetical protein BX600DRAFT_550556 [Xylariales sp. PMI_506]
MANSTHLQKKRLIVLCDGTWLNSEQGWSLTGTVQISSNVTRLSRALRRHCSDGVLQVIDYQSGVGTGNNLIDIIGGGAFGNGIAENIRAAYAFICANYVDGDEIILVGFSRGAYTARSVAGMICDLGLLTREGMEFFYPIFKDMENWRSLYYKDPYPGIPFHNKPRGDNAADAYKQMLLDRGLTRAYQSHDEAQPIKVKAVAVWDTVGSLGIPTISLVTKLGLPHSSIEYRFFDTNLSERIEYAFQALALDEHRPPFTPAVWERTALNKHATDLRQVWFPGNHANVGGGWADAGIANISLAWMMDQLASIGVEFDELTIKRIFTRLANYYRDVASDAAPNGADGVNADTAEEVLAGAVAAAADEPRPTGPLRWLTGFLPARLHWAVEPIYVRNFPVRPWGLGQLIKDRGIAGLLFFLAGYDLRTPNMYRRPDPWTALPTSNFLEDTHERIHCSVRVRLALKGLGLDDLTRWDAPALKGHWRLFRTLRDFVDPIPTTVVTWMPQTEEGIAAILSDPSSSSSNGHANGQDKRAIIDEAIRDQQPLAEAKQQDRWMWEYCGPENKAPPQRLLVEEPLGPYERQLLRMSGGSPNVYQYASAASVAL